MKIKESGIILFTENYEKAVDYYVHQIGLTLRLQKDDLSFLEFGNSYLLIEGKGVASQSEKTRAQSSVCLRIDVYDFDQTVFELKQRGVDVDVRRVDWGTIGIIIDPEGNRIEIKDGNF
ncbi:glyoxalase/bleomycin resistance/dioxygenase family protein [Paenibacillus sp. LMG 31461]|uniref:Glyoxalase/bleomycin resistance/dioxygenase family protein n=1 Tax=Paenibacillus plantarum TaxID=2654975 RepID=A0ABX1XKB0_9BACL|nr:VOC family protein [Paenibacillus plantarum]NOU68952.1 glyoxalase/bleomycin resistance/dioxygenase family protein [Paenibacillus plantarum]